MVLWLSLKNIISYVMQECEKYELRNSQKEPDCLPGKEELIQVKTGYFRRTRRNVRKSKHVHTILHSIVVKVLE